MTAQFVYEAASIALPKWAQNDPNVRIHAYRDMLILAHPERPPMVWHERATKWKKMTPNFRNRLKAEFLL